MPDPSGLYYPNRIARYFLSTMEDVMGKNGLNAVLSVAGLPNYIDQLPPDDMARQFDFADLAALSQALEDVYGTRGGRGMALRIGRACFARGLKNFGAMAGMAHPAFKALPLQQRIEIGADALTTIFNNFSDQYTVANVSDPEYITLSTQQSPFAWGRETDKPVCNALVGITQECMRWASNGYEFHVQEISCYAAGDDECVFRINKKPFGQL